MLILGAIVGLALAATPAVASSTRPAAGTFVEGPETVLAERQVGGSTIIHLTREAVISGTYSGVGQADQWIVIRADGSFTFAQTIAFTGLACGRPATLTFAVVGKGNFNDNVLTARYATIGRPDVGGGHGTLAGEPGVGGTYTGQVNCD
jgi:hypothetical protein